MQNSVAEFQTDAKNKLTGRQISQALALCLNGLQKFPDDTLLHNLAAQCHLANNDNQKALGHFKQACIDANCDADFDNNYGLTLRNQGDFTQSEFYLTRAHKKQKPHFLAWANLVNLYCDWGRYYEAEQLAIALINAKPQWGYAHNSYALVLEQQGHLNAAANQYKKALEIDKNNAFSSNNLALIKPYLPIEKTALKIFSDNKLNSSKTFLAWQNRSYEAGELDKVLSTTFPFANIPAEYYLHLALCHFDRGDWQQASLLNEKTLTINKNLTPALALKDSLGNRKTLQPELKLRIALHINVDFHYHILKPIFDQAQQHRVLFTNSLRQLVLFQPDVIVVSESHGIYLRSLIPNSKIVWTRHGLISKNTSVYACRGADYACLTSDESKQWYQQKHGAARHGMWVTGYPQMDYLFKQRELNQKPKHSGKTILYAPTWNEHLSSLPALSNQLVDLLRGDNTDIHIIIKPHPVTRDHHPNWIEQLKLQSQAQNVVLIDDASSDIMPLMLQADLLVSDFSSAIFQFLALDKPIVLFTNPNYKLSTHFDPLGIEWLWRDLADQTQHAEQLKHLVSTALATPGMHNQKRQHYRDRLFGSCQDGKAAQRIVSNIQNLAN